MKNPPYGGFVYSIPNISLAWAIENINESLIY